MTSPTLRACNMVGLGPVFAVCEGSRIDTARGLVCLAMSILLTHRTPAVRAPPLGIHRYFDKGHLPRGGGFAQLTGALPVGCLFGQSKRPQSLRLFTSHLDVGLILHHSLCAFFCTLLLLETCFGAGSGLIRFGCQCRLLLGPDRTSCSLSMFILENFKPWPIAQVTLAWSKNGLTHPSN
jgi:hypothetical protein